MALSGIAGAGEWKAKGRQALGQGAHDPRLTQVALFDSGGINHGGRVEASADRLGPSGGNPKEKQ